MAIYAVLAANKSSGTIRNIISSLETPKVNWIPVLNITPQIGWTYDEVTANFSPPAVIVDTTPTFNLANLVITRNIGDAVPAGSGKYYLDPSDTVEVSGDIVDGDGVVQDFINAPIIKLPIVKHADDAPTDTEFYMTGNIVAGVLYVTGKFADSGNYKALASRNNRALDRLGAGFRMLFDDVDFLV